MDESYSGIERRKQKRLRVNLTVVYRVDEPLAMRLVVGGKEFEARMLDLSQEGMAILSNHSFDASTTVLLRFTLFKVETEDVGFYGPMAITGEVRYCVPLGGGEYRLGIYFTQIDQKDKAEIADFVKRNLNILKPKNST
jgi:c-di-GMP-binding flagellar brake protein YcgR